MSEKAGKPDGNGIGVGQACFTPAVVSSTT